MAESWKRVWAGVVRVEPRRGDHRVALRAAVCVAVPLVALFMLGRLDLSIYASFGAFAALYGRHDLFRDRIRMQASAGGVLVAAMLVGTALSVTSLPAIASVIVVAVLASTVTLLAYMMQWHPPGALFPVFAIGACATIPATTSTFLPVLLVGGMSVLFALGVTVAIAAVMRRPQDLRRRGHLPVGDVAWEMAITVGVATLAAGVAGLLIVGSHWYWATVGAVAAVSGAHVSARVTRGIQRLVGTLLGVIVAAGLLALNLPPLAVIGMAVVLQVGAEMFVGRNYAIAMLFVTPLALLMVGLAIVTPPDVLLRDRAVETTIGVTVGTIIAVISAAFRRRQPRVQAHP